MTSFLNVNLIDYSPISNDQRSIEKAMVIFSVKDRDLLGFSNQYIAECFLPFNEIVKIQPTEQIRLTLSRPKSTGEIFKINLSQIMTITNYINSSTDCPYVNALKLREGDKLAKDFMKKLKQKMS